MVLFKNFVLSSKQHRNIYFFEGHIHIPTKDQCHPTCSFREDFLNLRQSERILATMLNDMKTVKNVNDYRYPNNIYTKFYSNWVNGL